MQHTCPSCQHIVESPEGTVPRFCEECGSAFVQEAASPDAVPPAPAERSGVYSWDLAARSREMALQLGAYQPASPLVSCEHLKVEYRDNLYFLAGAQIPIEMKITPLLKETQSILIWFSPQIAGEKSVARDIPVDANISMGKPFTLHVPYLSGETVFGVVPFRFYFACINENDVRYYQMTTLHQVFRKDQSVESLVSQITINASEAGTINANLNELLAHGRSRSANELLEQLNRSNRQFTVASLEETAWRPESSRVEGIPYECDRLTLAIEGHLYQLVSKPVIKLGREPSMVDVVIADRKTTTSLREHPNNTVSGIQTEIHYCGDSINFFDRSRHGTYINDIRPRNEGMRLPNEATVEFGDIHWRMEIQHCEQKSSGFICKTCLGHHVKSLSFTRKDTVPESYVLLWECCELGYLDRHLAGFAVHRRNNGFILRTPDQKFLHLVPGKKMPFGNIVIETKIFQQFGF